MGESRPLLERLKQARPYTTWKRYSDANGDLLAAGVGYFAFFSVFPALALAFAVFGFVLQGRPDLLEGIADYLNGILPGMVRTHENPDGVIGLEAPQTSTLTITGIVSVATLLLTGLGWVGALRTGIRGVFGLPASTGNAVTTKLRDLGVLLSLGAGISLSAILTGVVGGLAAQVAGWVGLGESSWVVTVVGLVLGVVFDLGLLVLLLRVLSDVPLPWNAARDGALVGAVLLTGLKFFGGLLIARATGNPLLGAVAVAVGLLFWLNLMSRVTLLSAAWSAVDLDIAGLAVEEPAPPADTPHAHPNEPDAAHPAARHAPSRAVDRVSLAAGTVLGAVAGVLVSSMRRLRSRPRRCRAARGHTQECRL